MRNAICRIAFFVAFLFPASVLTGQVATGVYPFGTYDTAGIDTINVGNLNVHLSLPVLNKPGRGLPFHANLVYDNSIYYPSGSGPYTQWTPLPQFGWGASTGLLSGQVLYDTNSTVQTYTDSWEEWNFTINCYYTQYGPWTYLDSSGVAHLFNVDTMSFVSQDTYPPDGWTCPSDGTSTASAGAIDGSGYQLSITGYTTASITAPNGVDALNPGGVSTSTDSNGNQLSTDGSGNYTDTTGNNVLSVTGSMTSSQYYKYKDTGGTWQQITVNYSSYTVQTAFGCSGISEYGPTTQYLVSSISYPDGDTYSFSYEGTPGVSGNVTGRLSAIQTPQGSSINYSYTGGSNGIECADGSTSGLTRTLASSGGSAASTWTYTRPSAGQTTVVDGLSNSKLYTFVAASNGIPTQYYESTRNVYQGAATGTPLLSRTTCYNCGGVSASPETNIAPTPVLPITDVDTYEAYNGVQMDGATQKYDGTSGMELESDIYDFGGSGSRGSLLRKEAWSYYVPIQGFPLGDAIFDGSGNLIGGSAYGYDGATPSGPSGVTQHIAVTAPRGNLTSITQYANASTTYTTNMTYEDTGSLLTSTFVPTGAVTTQSYDPTFVYLITTQLPSVPSGVTLQSTGTYDTATTGLPLTTSDANSQTTTVHSYDSMLRPTEVDYPDGGKATWSYTATQLSQYSYQSSGVYADQETQLDGYGRASRVAVANGTGSWYQQDTCYDGNGNVSFSSYPYQASGFGAAKVCSGAGITYSYDALGRVLSISQSDGEARNISYSGRAKESTDEMGISRIRQSDGLGRLTTVCEITSSTMPGGSGSPTSCGTDISGTGYLTTYTYNMATGTTTVSQGGQTRTFQADWLGRPTSVIEPESGTTTYSYTYNSTGLQVTRVKPTANQSNPSVTTNTVTQLDTLGRPVGITYSDGTPNKYYTYDLASIWGGTMLNTKGRLVNQGSAADTQSIYSYDPMGRVAFVGECAPSNCGGNFYWSAYSYDQLGNLLTEQVGNTSLGWSGNTDTYTYSVANELTSLTRSVSDAYHPPDIISSVQNSPFGPTSWQLGNGLTAVRMYDALGRVQGNWVCNGSASAYCSGGTQLYGFYEYWQGSYSTGSCDTVLAQCSAFYYDQLGRLSSQNVDPGGFTYVYDRWGNRLQQNVTSGSGPQPNLSFNSANQITNSGFVYDAAGNMTSDGSHNYTYDADGNLTQVDSGSTANYAYDALNHRVRYNYSGGSLEYNFNAAGQRVSDWDAVHGSEVAETTYWGAAPVEFDEGGYAQYEHQNWLGTERMRTKYDGTVDGTFVSLPFGDGFSTSGNDNDPYHFAGLDHDYTSNTDHAQFRQYANMSGRWMSPDPYSGSYHLGNPQTMNRYTYAMNNPLSNIDPSGLAYCYLNNDGNDPNDPGIDPSTIDDEPSCEAAQGTWIPDVTTTITVSANPDPDPDTEGPPPIYIDFGPTYSFSWGPGGPSSAGGGGGGAPNNPANPANPCSGANPNNLNYTAANGQQHIMQNHMAGGKGPGIYAGDWTAIQLLNQATLTMGTRSPSQLLRDARQNTYTLQWTAPPMIWPLSLIFTNNIGWSSPGQPTPTNRLVVTTNCSTVVTSYPVPQ